MKSSVAASRSRMRESLPLASTVACVSFLANLAMFQPPIKALHSRTGAARHQPPTGRLGDSGECRSCRFGNALVQRQRKTPDLLLGFGFQQVPLDMPISGLAQCHFVDAVETLLRAKSR